MTDGERRVVEAAVRLVARMKAVRTWPVEATSQLATLKNAVDALADARDLSRFESAEMESRDVSARDARSALGTQS